MARKPKETNQLGEINPNQKAVPDQVSASNFKDSVIELTQNTVYLSQCGGALKNERERQKLSTQEIAGQLRLSKKQIEAIEADNFSSLPESTIVKGFIRNYAKALKLNSIPLIEAYDAIVPESARKSISLQPPANMRITNFEDTNYKKLIIILVCLGMVFAIWFFYGKYVQKPSPISPSATLTEPVSKEPLPESALPAAERAGDYDSQQNVTLPQDNSTLQGLPQPSVSGNSSQANTNANNLLPEAPVVSNSSSNSINQNTSSVSLSSEPSMNTNATSLKSKETPSNNLNAGSTKLAFDANQQTWIGVVDAQGKEIYNKTLFAGNHEVIEVKKPVSIVVGNAHGATLNVDDNFFDLAPHTHLNVARVKID